MNRDIRKNHEYQGVRDEIRQQHQKTKDMSLKEKISYFLYYYKFHTLIVIVAIAVIVTLVHDIVTSKDYCFNAIMLNVGSDPISGTELSSDFSGYANLDTKTYECYIDTATTFSLQSSSQYDMVTSQKIFAMEEAGDLDCFVMDSEVFYHYAVNELFMDLSSCFTDEELEKYADYLYYIDYIDVEEVEEVNTEAETHRHPEEMENPVLVGIFVSDSAFIEKTEAYPDAIPVFGIVNSSHRTDTCKKYLEFLFDESVDFSHLIGQGIY